MQAHERLEAVIGEWAGFPAGNVVACSSGTAALHLALEGLGLPLGSEVIVPDFTMIACPRAVVLAGLTPVFVDCRHDLLSWPLDMWSAASPITTAVMFVHVYGRSCGLTEKTYEKMIWPKGLKVVEDLAEAHGVKPHPLTDAACWSFYRNKIIAGEEGGAVAFRDPSHAAKARSLRCLGMTEAHDFLHAPRGHNYRLAPSLAELVLHSFSAFLATGGVTIRGDRAFPSVLAWRRNQEAQYDAFCPTTWRMPPRDAPWVYDLRIKGMSCDVQDEVVAALREAGIEARHGFKPMHLQAEFRGCRRVGGEEAERASREVIYLPLGRDGPSSPELAARAFRIIGEALD